MRKKANKKPERRDSLYTKLMPYVEAHAQGLLNSILNDSQVLIEEKLKAKHSMFTGLEMKGAEVTLTIIRGARKAEQ